MSTIGKRVFDKKTGDIGIILNIYHKYDKGEFVIIAKVEFEIDGDTLSYERNMKDLHFV